MRAALAAFAAAAAAAALGSAQPIPFDGVLRASPTQPGMT
jgi:hypothetical protein